MRITNLKRIEWKLAGVSVALIAVGVLAFDASMRLSRGAADPDAIEVLGFALMLLVESLLLSLA